MDISTLKTHYYGNGISTNFCVKKYLFLYAKLKVDINDLYLVW